jgi:hypothetical protein
LEQARHGIAGALLETIVETLPFGGCNVSVNSMTYVSKEAKEIPS